MQLFHLEQAQRDVHPVQNLLLCTKFLWKSDDFSLRYGDITIFKMATVRHLGIVLPPYETIPRSLCCWLHAAACQISSQSNAQIWRYSYLHFSHIWLDSRFFLRSLAQYKFYLYLYLYYLFRPLKWWFWGLRTHKCEYSSSRPQKGTFLRKSASFKLSTVKIRWGVWPVGDLTESVTDTQTHRHTQVNLYSAQVLHSIGQTKNTIFGDFGGCKPTLFCICIAWTLLFRVRTNDKFTWELHVRVTWTRWRLRTVYYRQCQSNRGYRVHRL